MKKLKLQLADDQRGFIPMMLCIIAVIAFIIYLVYSRVASMQ